MRVISGIAKGRALKAVPGTDTRPTSDKVKEALFSMIGPYFTEGIVLDLYAGTGALGIEALSRGAEKAIFIDVNRTSIQTIHHNLTATGLAEHAEVYRNDAQKALRTLHKRGLVFDYIFMDPPYRVHNMDKLLHEMSELALINIGAICVVEHDAAVTYPEKIGPLRRERHAKYGEIALSIYVMEGVEAS